MLLIKELQTEIEESVKNFTLPSSPVGLNEPIHYILNLGGKRIRPLLVLLANELYGGKRDGAINAALAIELFHNFTLMHDDIMDEAPKRRGFETVHTKYDVNTAILSGDVMLIYAYQLLEGLDSSIFKRVFASFNDVAVKVCEGQQYDMNYETSDDVSIADYIKMIELKTAVLLGCSLQVGSIIGGASVEEDNLMYDFGRNIGIAFQIQDDILDVYGGAGFGKQVGGDILQDKKTFLLLTALKLAEGQDKQELEYWIGNKDNPEEKVNAVTEIYNRLNIRSIAEEEMEKYNDLAFESLHKLNLVNKEPLEYIAGKLLKRVV